MSESKQLKVIDIEEYYVVQETHNIISFTKIPKPRQVRKYNIDVRSLLALKPQEMFRMKGNRKCVASWAAKWGRKLNRKFVTRSRSETQMEIYRVE